MNWAMFRSEADRGRPQRKRAMFGSSGPHRDELGDVSLFPHGTFARRWLCPQPRARAWHSADGVVHALSMAPIPLRSKRRGGQGVDNPVTPSARLIDHHSHSGYPWSTAAYLLGPDDFTRVRLGTTGPLHRASPRYVPIQFQIGRCSVLWGFRRAFAGRRVMRFSRFELPSGL